MARSNKPFLSPRFDPIARTFRDCPTFRGFPLGGIGTGGVSLFADGGFGEARLNHSWFVAARDLRGSFFAIRTHSSRQGTKSKLLRRGHHDSREFAVDNVAHTTFRGAVPACELRFEDDLPVDVRLKGLSPLIPHDVKHSAMPIVYFTLDVENREAEDVDVSLLFSWQNVLGITGTGGSPWIPTHTFRVDESRHGFARAFERDALYGVKFGIEKDYAPTDSRRRGIGEHVIAADRTEGVEFSRCLAWDERKDRPSFWDAFTRTGSLSTAPSESKGRSGATCARVRLRPGEKRSLGFYLAWWNPHYVLEKHARVKNLTGRHDGIDHGIYAANFFSGVDDLVTYAAQERASIGERALALRSLLEDPERTRLPVWLVDTILNSADVMITNSVLTRSGEYYTIEGMDWPFLNPLTNTEWPFGALTGTNDQRLSSHLFTAIFYPELDRRELETFGALTRNGKVPHGNGGAEIALGDTKTPYSEPIAILNGGKTDWPDLTCSWILQVGKLIKTTDDRALLARSWPRMLEMDGYLRGLEKDGIPEGASTYDIFVYEPCFLYTGTLYVATLRMLGDLAELVGGDETLRASEFRARADRAARRLEARLWKGSRGYYRVCEGKDTLFQGGLAGDWICRLSGLPPVLPLERARSHARWQHRCLVSSARRSGPLPVRFGGRPLPYNEATEKGEEVPLKQFGLVKKHAFSYIYQAISYQGLEAIYLGEIEAGLDLLHMVYEKVFEEGYPWDMNLLGLPGFVYMTHPVVWAFFHAITGAAIDIPREALHLAPKLLPGASTLRTPVFFPEAWLLVDYDASSREGRVEVIEGPRASERRHVIRTLVLTDEEGTRSEVSCELHLEPGRSITFRIPAHT